MTNPGNPKMLRCPKCDKILEMDDIHNVIPPLVSEIITVCGTCYNLSRDFTHEAKQIAFDYKAKMFGIEWEWNQRCKTEPKTKATEAEEKMLQIIRQPPRLLRGSEDFTKEEREQIERNRVAFEALTEDRKSR